MFTLRSTRWKSHKIISQFVLPPHNGPGSSRSNSINLHWWKSVAPPEWFIAFFRQKKKRNTSIVCIDGEFISGFDLPVFDVPIMIIIIHRIRRINVFELAIALILFFTISTSVVFKRFRYLSLPSSSMSLRKYIFLFHFYVFSFPICH